MKSLRGLVLIHKNCSPVVLSIFIYILFDRNTDTAAVLFILKHYRSGGRYSENSKFHN